MHGCSFRLVVQGFSGDRYAFIAWVYISDNCVTGYVSRLHALDR